MRMISLSRLLGFHSGDAPSFNVCSQCGSAFYRYDSKRQCEHRSDWRRGVYVADTVEPKSLDPQFPALLDSMRRYGMTTPVLVSGSKYGPPAVYNGHHRIAAAFALGWESILIGCDWGEMKDRADYTTMRTGWREGDRAFGY